jgi:predicted DNA repair protein MutK
VATGSLIALFDDIATVLDDVSALTTLAAKKTAGVVGDDLALNAQQLLDVRAARELPVVWAVAKGSLINKAILVPAALAISTFAPWMVTPLLVFGGLFLCYEGVEKLAHQVFRDTSRDDEHHAQLTRALADPDADLRVLERDKINGAVRTDFILSAEIIVIALGIVAQKPLPMQVAVMVTVAVLMTVGVYGLVAGIVKIDDLGLLLSRRGGMAAGIGRSLLRLAPWLMKGLSVAGTAAMFLVGGGILVHAVPAVRETLRAAALRAGASFAPIVELLTDLVAGVVAGTAALVVMAIGRRLLRAARAPAPP